MTLLLAINYILQFLFIRIYKSIDAETKKVLGYGVLYWVYPLTGWSTKYKTIGKMKFTKPLKLWTSNKN